MPNANVIKQNTESKSYCCVCHKEVNEDKLYLMNLNTGEITHEECEGVRHGKN